MGDLGRYQFTYRMQPFRDGLSLELAVLISEALKSENQRLTVLGRDHFKPAHLLS